MKNIALAQFISKFNVAVLANSPSFLINQSAFTLQILMFLYKRNLIYGYQYLTDSNFFPLIKVFIKYKENKKPLISKLKILSSSTRKYFINITSLKKLLRKQNFNAYILVLSTDKGLLTHTEAIAFNIGGELLFSIR